MADRKVNVYCNKCETITTQIYNPSTDPKKQDVHVCTVCKICNVLPDTITMPYKETTL